MKYAAPRPVGSSEMVVSRLQVPPANTLPSESSDKIGVGSQPTIQEEVMSATLAVREVLPGGFPTLNELATEINSGHQDVLKGLSQSLALAIGVGDALCKAQKQIPDGQWDPWVKENISFSKGAVQNYMRLSEFSHLLKPTDTRPMGISEALDYLQSLGTRRYRAGTRPEDRQRFYSEVKKLHDGGMSRADIGLAMGISKTTVAFALMPNAERVRYQKNRTNKARRRYRARKRIEQYEAMKNYASGDLTQAYALVRKALQQTQSAYDKYPPDNAKRKLKKAMTSLHAAEDALSDAMKDIESTS